MVLKNGFAVSQKASEAVEAAESLVSVFQERGSDYDARNVFPSEDFVDLGQRGLLSVTVPVEYGGLGLGIEHGEALGLWLVDKAVAKGDLSLSRCYEGHVNMVQLLATIGTEEQKRELLPKVVHEHRTFVAWGSEPQKSSEVRVQFGTTVVERPDGWVINGRKAFSTSAGGADFAVLYVNTAGAPGSPRQAGAAANSVIMLIVDTKNPGIEIDTSWWDAMGMRSTVSHAVTFHDVFVPKGHLLGHAGVYTEQQWQAKFLAMFGASYTGAAEAAMEFAKSYVRSHDKAEDPYVQHHIAAMEMNVRTALLWLQWTAQLWDSGRVIEAQVAANQIGYVAQGCALDTLQRSFRACGARSALRSFPLERIFRDLNTYVLHENYDASLATIGKAALGLDYDPSFYTAPRPSSAAADSGVYPSSP